MKTNCIIYFGETKVTNQYLIKIDPSLMDKSESEIRYLITNDLNENYLEYKNQIIFIKKVARNVYVTYINNEIKYFNRDVVLSNKIGDTFNYKIELDYSNVRVKIKTYLNSMLAEVFLSNLICRLMEQYGIIPSNYDRDSSNIEVTMDVKDVKKLGVNPDKELYYSCILVEKEVLNTMNAILRKGHEIR